MANSADHVGPYNYAELDFPTRKAWGIIAVALVLAFALYMLGGKSIGDDAVKLADLMIQGAIITVLFTILAKGLGVVLRRQP